MMDDKTARARQLAAESRGVAGQERVVDELVEMVDALATELKTAEVSIRTIVKENGRVLTRMRKRAEAAEKRVAELERAIRAHVHSVKNPPVTASPYWTAPLGDLEAAAASSEETDG